MTDGSHKCLKCEGWLLGLCGVSENENEMLRTCTGCSHGNSNLKHSRGTEAASLKLQTSLLDFTKVLPMVRVGSESGFYSQADSVTPSESISCRSGYVSGRSSGLSSGSLSYVNSGSSVSGSSNNKRNAVGGRKKRSNVGSPRKIYHLFINSSVIKFKLRDPKSKHILKALCCYCPKLSCALPNSTMASHYNSC
ncbi:hypothetical protein PsorP6_014801 [Peronosclerospora sorghi]|uniref:Uncharacterized protein n=1 Tax=Peronosclerospora sorghi TaxID=230839 RepID=A0ACC0VT76_9STRA|nr:hypothetical protein PsorP6_014801 [Peronosclerospora sorghi]